MSRRNLVERQLWATVLLWMCWPTIQRQQVSLDLRHGIVKGYSDYISFLTTPQPSWTKRCDAQAVVRIDFSGSFNRAKLSLEYDRPRLWTLDVSDSQHGDGYGGDNGTTSNMAETHIFNRQLRIYGNSLPGYLDATIDGGYLLKIVDNVVNTDKKVTLDISDEKIEWSIGGGEKQFIESKFLYTLSGQNTTFGDKDSDVYAGFNRVVAGNFRFGSGLCRVTITLYQDGDGTPVLYLHLCHIPGKEKKEKNNSQFDREVTINSWVRHLPAPSNPKSYR
ncbi:hypothetical protein CAPTEDRAFT_195743 [Capitella teleta]|uniref:Alpha-carbonic anhydrase domain-containing protein n=1 Tax=Capitella teleta TaxID=283909 RepID=R7UHN6_CAPTE|nr:hypothetical protein CAPTEDRAFT_195743 [Capitella teleta]|eukprot:ELU05578.1 hypothetical protein CAPTEDRAFT_195743 [Capitella teleta]